MGLFGTVEEPGFSPAKSRLLFEWAFSPGSLLSRPGLKPDSSSPLCRRAKARRFHQYAYGVVTMAVGTVAMPTDGCAVNTPVFASMWEAATALRLRPSGRDPLLNNTQKCEMFTHQEECIVRTNIEIDDRLMRQAMRRSGAASKKATVEKALRLLLETHAQTSIRRLRGKVLLVGNLDQSRLGRISE